MSMQLNVTVNPVFNTSSFTSAGASAGASFSAGLNSAIGKSQPLGRITGQVSEFQKSMAAANARVLAFGASAGSIFIIKSAFDKLIASTIEVEKSLADISSVLGMSTSSVKNFANEIFKAAAYTGQTFETASKVALEFSRQGANAADTAKRMKAALELMRISGLNADESVNSITASLNAFAQEALSAEDIVNRLTAVDTKFAVSSKDLANAIQRVGAVASDVGIEFNQLLGLVTAAQTITARGGAVIGNAFKSIFTRLARPQVLEDLESVGVVTRDASGQLLPMINILKNLANQYNSLGASQRSFISESVGGVYQVNILKAALADLGNGISVFDRATLAASQSTGTIDKRMAELNETISSKLNTSAIELTKIFSNIGQTAFGSSAKSAIDSFNKNISFLGSFLEEISPDESIGMKIGKTFAQGMMKGIGGIISGPGVQLAVVLLTKLFSDIGKFAIDAGKDFLGMTDAVNKQKSIVESISNFLSRNPQILDAIKNGQLNINQAHLIYLKQLQQENQLKSQNAAIANQMAQKAAPFITASKPTTPAAGFIPNTAASGFVPNFNLSDSENEKRLAISHGYAPGPTYKTLIHDGNGKASLTTVNAAEKVKTIINESGRKATFVIPPNGFGKNTQFAAAGFIPASRAFNPAKVLLRDEGVHDGDSLKVNFYPAPDPISITSRLIGADAFELGTEKGKKAKQLLIDHMINKFGDISEGIDVTKLFKDAGMGEREKYGRPFHKDDDFVKKLKQHGLDKSTSNKASGFIPNFASKIGVITGDALRGNQYKKALEYLANTNKPVTSIVGPAGSGKTSRAVNEYGGEIIRSTNFDDYESFIFDRAGFELPEKDKTSAENIQKILRKSGSIDVLISSRDTLKKAREKRAEEGDQNIPERSYFKTGSGGAGTFVKGVRQFLSENENARVFQLKQGEKGFYHSQLNLASGFIPNFAEQTGPENPQAKISDAAIIAGSFQQVWDKKISQELQKEAERKAKAKISKSTPTTEEANLRLRYEETAGTALTNYLESSPELAYTKILQRFHTNTLPGGGSFPGFDYILDTFTNNNFLKNKLNWKDNYSMEVDGKQMAGAKGKMLLSMKTSEANEKAAEIRRKMELGKERLRTAGALGAEEQTSEILVGLYGSTLSNQTQAFKKSKKQLGKEDYNIFGPKTKYGTRGSIEVAAASGFVPNFGVKAYRGLDLSNESEPKKLKDISKPRQPLYIPDYEGEDFYYLLRELAHSRMEEENYPGIMGFSRDKIAASQFAGRKKENPILELDIPEENIINSFEQAKILKEKYKTATDFLHDSTTRKEGPYLFDTEALAGYLESIGENINAKFLRKLSTKGDPDKKGSLGEQEISGFFANPLEGAKLVKGTGLGSVVNRAAGFVPNFASENAIKTMQEMVERAKNSKDPSIINEAKIAKKRLEDLGFASKQIKTDDFQASFGSGGIDITLTDIDEQFDIEEAAIREYGKNAFVHIQKNSIEKLKNLIKNNPNLAKNFGALKKEMGDSIRVAETPYAAGFVPNFFNYLNEARNILKESGLNLDNINNQNFSQFKEVIKSKVGGTNIGEYEKALENYLYGGSTGWSLKKPSSKSRGGYREFGSGFVPNFALPDFGANQNITLSKTQIEDALKKAKTTGNYEGLEHLIYQSLTSKIGTGKDLTPLQKNISKEEKEAYAASLNNVDKNNGAWAQWDVKKTGNKPSDKRIDNYKSYFSMDFNSLMALNKNGAELKQKLTPLTEKYGMDLSFKVPGGALSGLTHNDSLVVHYTNNQAAQEVEQTVNDFIKSKKMSSGTRAYNRGIDLINKNVGLPTKDSLGRQTPVSSYGGYLAKQITHDLASGTSLQESISKRIKNAFGSGFVPNFNSKALAEAKNREMAAGYSSSEVKVGYDSRLKKSGGVGVYNKDEGSLANAIDIHLASGKNLNQIQTQGAANGFVPNFGVDFSALMGFVQALGSQSQIKPKLDQVSFGYDKQIEKTKALIQAYDQVINEFKITPKSDKKKIAELDTKKKSIEADYLRETGLDINKKKVRQAESVKIAKYETEFKEKKESVAKTGGALAAGGPFVGAMISSAAKAFGASPDVTKGIETLGEGAGMAGQVLMALPNKLGVIGAVGVGMYKLSEAVTDMVSGVEAAKRAYDKQKEQVEKSNAALNSVVQNYEALNNLYKSGSTSLSQLVNTNRRLAQSMSELAAINPELARKMREAGTTEKRAEVQAEFAEEQGLETARKGQAVEFLQRKRENTSLFGIYNSAASSKYGQFTPRDKQDVSVVESMLGGISQTVQAEIFKGMEPEQARGIQQRLAEGTATKEEDVAAIFANLQKSETFQSYGEKEQEAIKAKLAAILDTLSIEKDKREQYVNGLNHLKAKQKAEEDIRARYNQELQNTLSKGTIISQFQNRLASQGVTKEGMRLSTGYTREEANIGLASLVSSEAETAQRKGDLEDKRIMERGSLEVQESRVQFGSSMMSGLSEEIKKIIGDAKEKKAGEDTKPTAPSERSLKMAEFFEKRQKLFSGEQKEGKPGAIGLAELMESGKSKEEIASTILGKQDESGLDPEEFKSALTRMTTYLSSEKPQDETGAHLIKINTTLEKTKQEAVQNSYKTQAAIKEANFKEAMRMFGGIGSLLKGRGAERAERRRIRQAVSRFKSGRTEETRGGGAGVVLASMTESQRDLNDEGVKKMYEAAIAARKIQMRDREKDLPTENRMTEEQLDLFAKQQIYGELRPTNMSEEERKALKLDVAEQTESPMDAAIKASSEQISKFGANLDEIGSNAQNLAAQLAAAAKAVEDAKNVLGMIKGTPSSGKVLGDKDVDSSIAGKGFLAKVGIGLAGAVGVGMGYRRLRGQKTPGALTTKFGQAGKTLGTGYSSIKTGFAQGGIKGGLGETGKFLGTQYGKGKVALGELGTSIGTQVGKGYVKGKEFTERAKGFFNRSQNNQNPYEKYGLERRSQPNIQDMPGFIPENFTQSKRSPNVFNNIDNPQQQLRRYSKGDLLPKEIGGGTATQDIMVPGKMKGKGFEVDVKAYNQSKIEPDFQGVIEAQRKTSLREKAGEFLGTQLGKGYAKGKEFFSRKENRRIKSMEDSAEKIAQSKDLEFSKGKFSDERNAKATELRRERAIERFNRSRQVQTELKLGDVRTPSTIGSKAGTKTPSTAGTSSALAPSTLAPSTLAPSTKKPALGGIKGVGKALLAEAAISGGLTLLQGGLSGESSSELIESAKETAKIGVMNKSFEMAASTLGASSGTLGKIGGALGKRNPVGTIYQTYQASKAYRDGYESGDLAMGETIGAGAGALAGGKAGALIGAAAGSFIPVAGTAVGAAIGGTIGSIGGAVMGSQYGKEISSGINFARTALTGKDLQGEEKIELMRSQLLDKQRVTQLKKKGFSEEEISEIGGLETEIEALNKYDSKEKTEEGEGLRNFLLKQGVDINDEGNRQTRLSSLIKRQTELYESKKKTPAEKVQQISPESDTQLTQNLQPKPQPAEDKQKRQEEKEKREKEKKEEQQKATMKMFEDLTKSMKTSNQELLSKFLESLTQGKSGEKDLFSNALAPANRVLESINTNIQNLTNAVREGAGKPTTIAKASS